MIALLSPAQIQAWDTYTIKTQSITDFALMQQASEAFVQAFCGYYSNTHRVYVAAGTGNNGGDGLCVAAILQAHGYHVEVFFLGDTQRATKSCQQALRQCEESGLEITYIKDIDGLRKTPLQAASADAVWIDALFGTGLNRALRATAKAVVAQLNSLSATCVAIDTPSGLLLDQAQAGNTAVQGAHIISLQVPKRAFLLPENDAYVRRWECVDIGLDKGFLSSVQPEHGYLLQREDIARWLPTRPRHLHKGQAGRGLLVAGSQGMFGAAILAAEAAMRGGAGAVHVHTPQAGAALLHMRVPEALVQADLHPLHVTRISAPKQVQAVAVGPGIGQHLPTAAALRKLFKTCSLPLILDADALNLLSAYPELLAELPAGSLLTPHAGELARLIGVWKDDYDKLKRLQAFATKTQCVILSKGAYSVIAAPGEPLLFNPTGHPGMATAGSGDVLTGLLLALRSAGVSALHTAAAGAFLHGLAGERAAQTQGSHGLIARGIIDQLPAAYLRVAASIT